MQVVLNIENDEELRTHIKEMIKGQVMSIVREEFLEIVRTELNRKVKGMTAGHFDEMIKQGMKQALGEMLREDYNITQWNKDFIKPHINDLLDSYLSGLNIEYLVNQAASSKVHEMAKATKTIPVNFSKVI